MVYFIRSPAGRIKIGTTIRLSQRLRQLAAEHGPGLEVLAVVGGSFDVERVLHGRFAHLRHAGKWFEPGDDLMGFIASDGRPWEESDDEPTGDPVRIPNALVAQARYISDLSGQSVEDYLNKLIRPQIEQDFRVAWHDLVGALDRQEEESISRGLLPVPPKL